MTSEVKPQFIHWLEQYCHKPVNDVQLIQPLWSGYGACFRARFKGADKPVVVKCAQPNPASTHPRGWQGEVSHNRKCASFAIECYFYRYLQPLSNNQCFIPPSIACEQKGDNSLLVMADLAELGYTTTATALSVTQAETVLKWLAAFHACFVYYRDEKVWQEGTYWHLATRQQELSAMPDGPLKRAAPVIAQKLSQAHYQTLVHGDAKVANFCFSDDFNTCAAIDFQYVGHGVGVKDVAYFLGSALSEHDQAHSLDALLNVYFSALEQQLFAHQQEKSLSHQDIASLIREWRSLYPLACADFHRFLAGWSPDHWKINHALRHQTRIALAKL